MGFVLRTLVTAASLWVALQLVPGLRLEPPLYVADPQTNYVVALAIVAILFGVLNAFIRPVIFMLALPFTCLTLGLFILVVNGLMLVILSWLPIGFHVDGLFSAIVGAVVVGVVSFVLNKVVPG